MPLRPMQKNIFAIPRDIAQWDIIIFEEVFFLMQYLWNIRTNIAIIRNCEKKSRENHEWSFKKSLEILWNNLPKKNR